MSKFEEKAELNKISTEVGLQPLFKLLINHFGIPVKRILVLCRFWQLAAIDQDKLLDGNTLNKHSASSAMDEFEILACSYNLKGCELILADPVFLNYWSRIIIKGYLWIQSSPDLDLEYKINALESLQDWQSVFTLYLGVGHDVLINTFGINVYEIEGLINKYRTEHEHLLAESIDKQDKVPSVSDSFNDSKKNDVLERTEKMKPSISTESKEGLHSIETDITELKPGLKINDSEKRQEIYNILVTYIDDSFDKLSLQGALNGEKFGGYIKINQSASTIIDFFKKQHRNRNFSASNESEIIFWMCNSLKYKNSKTKEYSPIKPEFARQIFYNAREVPAKNKL